MSAECKAQSMCKFRRKEKAEPAAFCGGLCGFLSACGQGMRRHSAVSAGRYAQSLFLFEKDGDGNGEGDGI